MKRLLIICSLALAGCKTQLAQFTVYCPKHVDLSTAQYRVDKFQKVSGMDRATLYLVIPSNAPSYDQAVRNAMMRAPGCVGLADMKITREVTWFLFGHCDFIAEGYPIYKKEAK